MEYDDYVVRGILANNQFGIAIVNGLQSINSLHFVWEEFPVIEGLIQSNDIEAIKDFSKNEAQTRAYPYPREYLEIMSFADQNGKFYIVAVYDSDILEQDPEVIKIYSPKNPPARNLALKIS